jgi:hypothetical protein
MAPAGQLRTGMVEELWSMTPLRSSAVPELASACFSAGQRVQSHWRLLGVSPSICFSKIASVDWFTFCDDAIGLSLTRDNTGSQLCQQPLASERRTSLQTVAGPSDILLIYIVRNDSCILNRIGLLELVHV